MIEKKSERNSLFVAGLILAVAFPTAAALYYARMMNDPTLRPLGITREKIAEAGVEDDRVEILIDVVWGGDTTGSMTPMDLRTKLEKTMNEFNVDYFIRMKEADGGHIAISYHVGENHFGPYTVDRAASGIKPAVAAFHMAKAAQ